MKKSLFILVFFSLASCAKKEDWECSCEIYTATSNSVETTQLHDMIKSDAQRECEKFGEEKAGKNGSHDCTLR
jgi:hypothetical protein